MKEKQYPGLIIILVVLLICLGSYTYYWYKEYERESHNP